MGIARCACSPRKGLQTSKSDVLERLSWWGGSRRSPGGSLRGGSALSRGELVRSLTSSVRDIVDTSLHGGNRFNGLAPSAVRLCPQLPCWFVCVWGSAHLSCSGSCCRPVDLDLGMDLVSPLKSLWVWISGGRGERGDGEGQPLGTRRRPDPPPEWQRAGPARRRRRLPAQQGRRRLHEGRGSLRGGMAAVQGATWVEWMTCEMVMWNPLKALTRRDHWQVAAAGRQAPILANIFCNMWRQGGHRWQQSHGARAQVQTPDRRERASTPSRQRDGPCACGGSYGVLMTTTWAREESLPNMQYNHMCIEYVTVIK